MAANTVYSLVKTDLLEAKIDLSAAPLKIALLDMTGGGYTPNFATDHHVSDIPGAAIVARSATLTGVTVGSVSEGTVDAADVTCAAVPAGHTIDAVLLYHDGGTDATSELIALIETAQDGTTALSLATNGSDITVQFNASGILDI